MALYDRPYMQFNHSRPRMNPLLWIIAVTVAVFFLQFAVSILFKQDLVSMFLGMSMQGLKGGFAWQIITYGFVHAGPMHLIFNMLGVFFAGRLVMRDIGERRFVALYGLAIVVGAALFLLINFSNGNFYLVGASAGLLGLLTVFCLTRPDEPLTFLLFFVLPVTVKPRYLLMVLIGIELVMLTAEVQGSSSVASSAHLGGILAGWLFHRKVLSQQPFFSGFGRKPQMELPRRPKPRPAKAPRYRINLTSRSDLRNEVDRILDKINSQGFGSLTPEEKRLLDKAKDILSK